MIDLEGITGFELGNILDTVPVLMDKRRNAPVPLWLKGSRIEPFQVYSGCK